MRVYTKAITSLFITSLFAIIISFYSAASFAQKPVLVLFPVEVEQSDAKYEPNFGTALQEGLQGRYQVFYGPAVEAELQKEYTKKDCNAERCIQNVAIAFNGELIANASATKVGKSYALKMVIHNVLTDEIVESKSYSCRDCDVLSAMDAFISIGKGKQSTTAPTANSNKGISLLGSNSNTGASANTGVEPAVLIFDSQPSGATVTINGSNAGLTPYQGLDHTMGDVLTISLSKEFYKPLRFKAELSKEFTRIKQAFVLEQGSGQLLLSFKPYQAGINLWEGTTNHGELPLRLNLSAGPHQFQARLQNKVLAEGSASINEGGRQQLVLQNAIALPTMLSIPSGNFKMGSNNGDSDEKPVHRVSINAFKLAKTEVTRGQFKAFVDASGYKTDAEKNAGGVDGCYSYEQDREKKSDWTAGVNWRNVDFDGITQSNDHPVVCVSFNDVSAYINWLNDATGQHFRLPSEAEWEYAARAGSTGDYFYGSDTTQQCQYGNGTDTTKLPNGDSWNNKAECNDGYLFTAPVASYKANRFGVKDTLGNVWEWVADCYQDSYSGAPSNGSARTQCEGARRVLRGGSWLNRPANLRSSNRSWNSSANRSDLFGFRLAQDL